MKFNVFELSGQCECGQEHHLSTNVILNEVDALKKLKPFLINEQLDQEVLVICDQFTIQLLNPELKSELGWDSFRFMRLDATNLHADEVALDVIFSKLPQKISVLIAFGSGTIHDLTRYTAHQIGVPFISVPTAASVDGFASTVAAMTLNQFKVTHQAVAPLAIFADPILYRQAPLYLTAAGVGDLLGKHTALLDWKVSHLLTNEPICDRVIQMTETAVSLLTEVVSKLTDGDILAFERLMDGLLLSGLAMQMVQSSRPASGAEHHLSHLWEMHIINEEVSALHGEKVGIGLLAVCEEYKKLLTYEECPKLKPFEQMSQKSELKQIFKTLYQEIVLENQRDALEHLSDEQMKRNFNEIKKLVQVLPNKTELVSLLNAVQGKVTLEEIGINESIKLQSLTLAPYVRPRVTLLKVMNRLALEK